MLKPIILITTLLGALSLSACTNGPAEKAGLKADMGVEAAKEAVSPPGPGQKAGQAIDKTTKKIKQAVS